MRHKQWLPRALRPAISWAVGAVEQASSLRWRGIVTASEQIAEQFAGRPNVAVVQNFPRLEEFPAVPAAEREPVAAYVGDLTVIRGAREMVAAIGRTSNVTLEMGGRFSPPELEAELRAIPGWERVRWRGWLARDDVAELMGRASLGLLLLHPVGNKMDARSGKLFEYLAAGLPVVVSDFPNWRPIIGDTGAGLLVDPLDPDAVAKAIDWIVGHPDEAGEWAGAGLTPCASGSVGVTRRRP